MTITTQMVWTMTADLTKWTQGTSGPGTRPWHESMLEAAQIQIDAMVAAGQTDGIKVITENSPVLGQLTAVRTWIDMPAAEEWIAFTIQYEPISATIIII